MVNWNEPRRQVKVEAKIMARARMQAEDRSLQTRAEALVAAGLITRMHAVRLVARREERVIADWEKRLLQQNLTPNPSPERRGEEQKEPAVAVQMALLEV